MVFRWNEWNLDHVREHGIEPAEAELVILRARAPYPEHREEDKLLVWGTGRGGRLVQVIYLLDETDRIYVIHTRPLSESEKRQFRRRYR